MLVTFSTKYHADIIMFGDIGLSMLKMMGHSGTVPGAILADDVAASKQKLTAALDSRTEVTIQNIDDNEEPVISLSNRALPLVELLDSAIKEGSDVMWK